MDVGVVVVVRPGLVLQGVGTLVRLALPEPVSVELPRESNVGLSTSYDSNQIWASVLVDLSHHVLDGTTSSKTLDKHSTSSR